MSADYESHIATLLEPMFTTFLVKTATLWT